MLIFFSNISGNFYRFFLISFRTQRLHSKTIITPEHFFLHLAMKPPLNL